MNLKIKNFYNSNPGVLTFLSLLFFIIWVIIVLKNFSNLYYKNIVMGVLSIIPFLVLGLMWIRKNLKKLSDIAQLNSGIIDSKKMKSDFLFGVALIIVGIFLTILIVFAVIFSPGAGSGLGIFILIFPIVFLQIILAMGIDKANTAIQNIDLYIQKNVKKNTTFNKVLNFLFGIPLIFLGLFGIISLLSALFLKGFNDDVNIGALVSLSIIFLVLLIMGINLVKPVFIKAE